LNGRIPPELGNLTNLRYLDFGYGNTEEATQPVGGLLNAFKPTWNQLNNNAYTAGNQLSGPIPEELGNLTQLEVLDLSWNELSGVMPATLSQLTSLRSLSLATNKLSGSIPEGLGNLPALQEVNLSWNELNGRIPPSLCQRDDLELLNVSHNQLVIPEKTVESCQARYFSTGFNSKGQPIDWAWAWRGFSIVLLLWVIRIRWRR
jgi:Leucine-rich repeat (LRR) protein